MPSKIGLSESLVMVLGGMVGGGIFAVLGVVAAQAGSAAWLVFVASGIVAFCAGFSFVVLNDLQEQTGTLFSAIETFTGSTTLAGTIQNRAQTRVFRRRRSRSTTAG
ncbi:hypothetical protein [Haloarchaeobius sp. DFWS5]|uniref:hypothetical protein n=1 Tax=Haloarchaeobius sp. DFWS5 TaxID=3446114 RepID=UPI003EC11DA8